METKDQSDVLVRRRISGEALVISLILFLMPSDWQLLCDQSRFYHPDHVQ